MKTITARALLTLLALALALLPGCKSESAGPRVEATSGGGNPASAPAPAKSKPTSMAVSGAIHCDCEHVDAGLLTGPYKDQCVAAEKKLKAKAAEGTFKVEVKDDKITGGDICDLVALGPNAWPRQDGPVNPPPPPGGPPCRYVGGMVQYECPK